VDLVADLVSDKIDLMEFGLYYPVCKPFYCTQEAIEDDWKENEMSIVIISALTVI